MGANNQLNCFGVTILAATTAKKIDQYVPMLSRIWQFGTKTLRH